ncbi:MAG: hypothetical protein HN790_15680 [Methylococcales bacterium]|nr:hypothetical protein [Methylococcales bacterium]
MKTYLKLGVTGIITNKPAVLSGVLKKAGIPLARSSYRPPVITHTPSTNLLSKSSALTSYRVKLPGNKMARNNGRQPTFKTYVGTPAILPQPYNVLSSALHNIINGKKRSISALSIAHILRKSV